MKTKEDIALEYAEDIHELGLERDAFTPEELRELLIKIEEKFTKDMEEYYENQA